MNSKYGDGPEGDSDLLLGDQEAAASPEFLHHTPQIQT